MSTVFMFPGQGSQYIGMGKDLYDTFPEAKEFFQEVDDALKRKLSSMIFNGNPSELTLTQNAQPAILAVSLAVLAVLKKQSGQEIGQLCSFVCGHSLGEYSAHAAAGTMATMDVVRLIQVRAEAMAKAASTTAGGMVALVGATIEQAEALCRAASGICDIGNDNGAGQIVLSGPTDVMEWVVAHAAEFGVKRAIALNVSGAFHSRLMEDARTTMRKALNEAELARPAIPLLANISADIVATPGEIRKSLAEQVTGRVRWRETMERLGELGANKFVEVGPGKVLSTIAKRIHANAYSCSICGPTEIEEILMS